jgi:hypothetical protein
MMFVFARTIVLPVEPRRLQVSYWLQALPGGSTRFTGRPIRHQ